MNDVLKKEIKETVKKSIRNFFLKKLKTGVKTTHVLDSIFPTERKIRSLIGGLETSMGTTLWEPLAKMFAKNNGFDVLEKEIMKPQPMPGLLSSEISKIRSERENINSWIQIDECKSRLREKAKDSINDVEEYISPPRGFGVDVFLTKDDKYFAYDIKTTQPNVEDFAKYNSQIINWYAYTYSRYPDRDITARIAFPFNPHKKDFWEKMGNKVFPLEKSVDALVENEFWDEISGIDNTFKHILSVFRELGDSDFRQEFSDIFYK